MRGITPIWFELKKFPWKLFGLIVLIVFSTAFLMTQNELQSGQGKRNKWGTISTRSNKQEIQEYALRDFEWLSKESKEVAVLNKQSLTEAHDFRAAAEYAKASKKAVQSNDNRTLNKLLYSFLSNDEIHNMTMVTTNDLVVSWYREKATDIPALLKYLIGNNIDASVILSPEADAANLIGRSLSLWWGGKYDEFQIILFASSVLLISLVFSYEQRKRTNRFMNATPLSIGQLGAVKMGVVTVLLAAVILAAFGLAMAVIFISPGGHALGSFKYPHFFNVQGQTHMITIGHYLLIILSYNVLLIVILSSIAFTLSRLLAPFLVQVFVLGVVAFFPQLQLLALVPSAIRNWIPMNYLSPREVALNLDGNITTSVAQGCCVILIWTVCIWMIGLRVKRSR